MFIPLQHLPLQEAVEVHAVLVVCERSSTQVVVDGPDATHTQHGELSWHTYNREYDASSNSPCNICAVWCVHDMRWRKSGEAERKQVRVGQTGEREERLTCGSCWRSPYMDWARGSLCTGLQKPLLCLHAEVTTWTHVNTVTYSHTCTNTLVFITREHALLLIEHEGATHINAVQTLQCLIFSTFNVYTELLRSSKGPSECSHSAVTQRYYLLRIFPAGFKHQTP